MNKTQFNSQRIMDTMEWIEEKTGKPASEIDSYRYEMIMGIMDKYPRCALKASQKWYDDVYDKLNRRHKF